MSSELAELMARTLHRAATEGQQCGEVVGDDLYLTAFSGTVVNVDARRRLLQRADVDAVRAALDEIGYVVVDCWIATQGLSWLSGGLSAGVSFRIRKAEEAEGSRG